MEVRALVLGISKVFDKECYYAFIVIFSVTKQNLYNPVGILSDFL